MATQQALVKDSAQAFFSKRLGERVYIVATLSPEILEEALQHLQIDPSLLGDIGSWPAFSASGEFLEFRRISDRQTLVIASLSDEEGEQFEFAACIDASKAVASQLVGCAVEAWQNGLELSNCRTALQESAMQMGQSFEEQNWLRGFARNALSINSLSDSSTLAERILQPLCYLLRAQGVFLLVHPEESLRSGLTSSSFGDSDFDTQTVLRLLNQLAMFDHSPPLVSNSLDITNERGHIKSVVAVAIPTLDQGHLGFLVAVNRSTCNMDAALPVFDPEFGSGDVGLLEEAAVLLTTQAQNMHLLLRSHQLCLGTLHAMSNAIDARDRYTQGHSERVARLSYELAMIQGLCSEACHEIYLSGILHDIGKIGVPDRVLLKPGKLTDEEFAIIKQHPEIGHRIVARLGNLEFTLPGVLHHHERWDGKGYPHRISGNAIPQMARIMAVADAFDAMTSSRPYRKAMPVEKARSIILAGSNEQWDSEPVEALDQWLQTRSQEVDPAYSNSSFIPMSSPTEHLARAVASLMM